MDKFSMFSKPKTMHVPLLNANHILFYLYLQFKKNKNTIHTPKNNQKTKKKNSLDTQYALMNHDG